MSFTRERRRQPVALLSVSREWRERGLAFVWASPASTQELVRNRIATISGVSSASKLGLRTLTTSGGTGAGVDFGLIQPIQSNTRFSIGLLGAPPNDANGKIAFSQRYGSGNTEAINLMFARNGAFSTDGRFVTLYMRNSAAGVGYADNAAGSANGPDGLMHLWGGTLDGVSAPKIWKDGAEIQDRQVAPSGTLVTTNQKTRLLNAGDYTADGLFANCANFALAFAFDNYALNAPEWKDLTANPWQIFTRRDRRAWFDQAAVSGQPPRTIHQFNMRRAA